MPYHVGTSSECPASKPHAVVKDSDGKVMGCHSSVADANRQIAAIHASEGAAVTSVISLAINTPNVTGDGYDGGTLAFGAGTPWEGVLAVEGVETGDGRMFAENSITWETPPLALRWNIEDSHGGQPTTKAVNVGRIDAVWRDPEQPTIIRGAGVFDDGGANGAEALRLVKSKFLKGISVDPDSIGQEDVELVFPQDAGGEMDELTMLFAEPELTIFHAGRLRAATLVDIPAFVEAKVWLVDPSTVPQAVTASSHFGSLSDRPWNGASVEGRISAQMTPTGIRAAYAHTDRNGDSKVAARFLHHEITDGGDIGFANLTACSSGIRVINSGRAGTMTEPDRRAAYEHMAQHLRVAGITPAPYVSGETLVAALESLEGPPAEWFTTPEPDAYRSLTVTDEVTAAGWRRVFGHGAQWNTCHTSFGDACVRPPREPNGDHAYFRLGEVVCADGSRIAVGNITLGTGHASTRGITPTQAVEHYDNTGTIAAMVASSEGQHGIWLTGAIPPWVSAERVAVLQAAGQVSGDWRRIGGSMRLVAFLAVNHPGFPVPRLTTFVSKGKQLSLVAAGIAQTDYTAPVTRRDPGMMAAMERIARGVGRDPVSRMNAIRDRVRG